MALHKNFIAGKWVDGVNIVNDINPSDTRELVGECASSGRGAADTAFPAWASSAPSFAAPTFSICRHIQADGAGSRIGVACVERGKMVNLPTAGVDCHAPFGGCRSSSYGAREQGSYAREFYTVVKTAYTQL